MKKSLLVGMALVSFSFSAFAQTSVPLQALPLFKSAAGITDNSGSVDSSIAPMTQNSMAMGMGNGIDNGAPDLSQMQEQLASANQNKGPVDLRSAPEGAESILRQGPNAFQTKSVNDLKSQERNQAQNRLLANKSNANGNGNNGANAGNNKLGNNGGLNQGNKVGVNGSNKPKADIVTTDMSLWNQSTIQEFEKQGKQRTEYRYRQFISN